MPAGLTVHCIEIFAVAPAYDIILMPCDLVQRPGYLAREREAERLHNQEMRRLSGAIFKSREVFLAALDHRDDKAFMEQLVWNIQNFHQVPRENLMAALEVEKTRPARDDALVRAVLRRQELGREVVLEYYKSARESGDMEDARVLLKNPAMPLDVRKAAYCDPGLVSLRYSAACSKSFKWPAGGTPLAEFKQKAEALTKARDSGEIDKKTFTESMHTLLTHDLPAEMPDNWQICL